MSETPAIIQKIPDGVAFNAMMQDTGILIDERLDDAFEWRKEMDAPWADCQYACAVTYRALVEENPRAIEATFPALARANQSFPKFARKNYWFKARWKSSVCAATVYANLILQEFGGSKAPAISALNENVNHGLKWLELHPSSIVNYLRLLFLLAHQWHLEGDHDRACRLAKVIQDSFAIGVAGISNHEDGIGYHQTYEIADAIQVVRLANVLLFFHDMHQKIGRPPQFPFTISKSMPPFFRLALVAQVENEKKEKEWLFAM